MTRLHEGNALDAVVGGQPFASMCEGLVRFSSDVDAPLRAATLLQRWVHDEWIVGIELPAEATRCTAVGPAGFRESI